LCARAGFRARRVLADLAAAAAEAEAERCRVEAEETWRQDVAARRRWRRRWMGDVEEPDEVDVADVEVVVVVDDVEEEGDVEAGVEEDAGCCEENSRRIMVAVM
jgi:hypothetical protein